MIIFIKANNRGKKYKKKIKITTSKTYNYAYIHFQFKTDVIFSANNSTAQIVNRMQSLSLKNVEMSLKAWSSIFNFRFVWYQGQHHLLFSFVSRSCNITKYIFNSFLLSELLLTKKPLNNIFNNCRWERHWCQKGSEFHTSFTRIQRRQLNNILIKLTKFRPWGMACNIW